MVNFPLMINSFGLLLSCFGLICSIGILLLICISIRPLKTNVPLILTCNTYVNAIVSSFIIVKGSSITVNAIVQNLTTVESSYCYFYGYLVTFALGSVFYSLILQAIFRLCRVVFARYRILQSVKIFLIAIILQWIVVFLVNLPFILFNDFEYISSEYRCQVPYTNARGSVMLLLVEYTVPSQIIFTIYLLIIRFIRRANIGMIQRHQAHRHDLLVLKQIFLILIVVQLLATPLVILWILYLTMNYLTSFSYQLQALNVCFSQLFVPIVLIFTTGQLREKIFGQHRRIHPIGQIILKTRRQCF